MSDDDSPVVKNLFPGALPHIAGWGRGRLESRSKVPHSSQALCVSVWGAIAQLPDRGQIMSSILSQAHIDLKVSGSPEVACEVRGEWDLLRERGGSNPTCPDVVVKWAGEAVLTIESKFTEHLGACSQPVAKRRGDRVLPASCNGNYAAHSDLRRPEVSACCRLTVQEGARQARRYWAIAPQLFTPKSLEPGQSPCPFKGGAYQLMRNLSFAAALGERDSFATRGFLLAYVKGSASAEATEKTFSAFEGMLLQDVRGRVGKITYEQIASLLHAHGAPQTFALATWLRARLRAVLPDEA
ncbi:hypothetical protein LBMAG42_37400 [Deltaproteobacteria bacterium]|nr:hypothetical protein LBMAG42_37400 [Deltaproteobacteria bacterium]